MSRLRRVLERCAGQDLPSGDGLRRALAPVRRLDRPEHITGLYPSMSEFGDATDDQWEQYDDPYLYARLAALFAGLESPTPGQIRAQPLAAMSSAQALWGAARAGLEAVTVGKSFDERVYQVNQCRTGNGWTRDHAVQGGRLFLRAWHGPLVGEPPVWGGMNRGSWVFLHHDHLAAAAAHGPALGEWLGQLGYETLTVRTANGPVPGANDLTILRSGGRDAEVLLVLPDGWRSGEAWPVDCSDAECARRMLVSMLGQVRDIFGGQDPGGVRPGALNKGEIHPLVWEQRPQISPHLDEHEWPTQAKEVFRKAAAQVTQEADWGRFAVERGIEMLIVFVHPRIKKSISHPKRDDDLGIVQLTVGLPPGSLDQVTVSEAVDHLREVLDLLYELRQTICQQLLKDPGRI